MKQCMIIDDDPLSRMTLEKLLQQIDGLTLVKSCASPLEAMLSLEEHSIDLLFLDVEMPEMSGLDFLRSLQHPPAVILVSAREQYAVEAFDLAVSDYLVKPVTLTRLLKAVHRVQASLNNPGAPMQESPDTQALFVKVGTQLKKVSTADVLWIEATGDYVTIHTERENYVAHATMKGIENKLPSADFVRVHRSYIIHLSKINAIEGNLVVIGTDLIPVAQSYRSAMMQRLNLI